MSIVIRDTGALVKDKKRDKYVDAMPDEDEFLKRTHDEEENLEDVFNYFLTAQMVHRLSSIQSRGLWANMSSYIMNPSTTRVLRGIGSISSYIFHTLVAVSYTHLTLPTKA